MNPTSNIASYNPGVAACDGVAATSLRRAEPDPRGMERDELRAYLRTHSTVTLWPFTGRALGASRSLTYSLGRSGGIRVLHLGEHRSRVASAWLESALFGDE